MTIFEEPGSIYLEIDNNYAKLEHEARVRKFTRKERSYQKKRETNNHAYFLFMFSRLEDRIKELSDTLIDHRYKTLSNWSYKRTWDILYSRKTQNPNSIYFMDRVALLAKKGNSDYNLIRQYYDQRNRIAHGGGFSIAIDMRLVIKNMRRLYRDLKVK